MSRLHVEITLLDDLSETWLVWFEGLHIRSMENSSTCLSGEIPDYPALYGLLERVRDLNLHLAAVQVEPTRVKGN